MIKATYNKDNFKVRLYDGSIVDVSLYGGNPTVKKICRELGTADFDVLAHDSELVTAKVSDADFLSAAINLGYVRQPAYRSKELIARTIPVKHWLYVYGSSDTKHDVYMPTTCEVFPYSDCIPVSMTLEKIRLLVPIWIFDSMTYSSISEKCVPTALIQNFSLQIIHFNNRGFEHNIFSTVEESIRHADYIMNRYNAIDCIETITYKGKQKYDRIVQVRGLA